MRTLKPTRPATPEQAASLAAMGDRELVDTFLAGDHMAFTEITRRHYSSLWYTARQHAASEQDADDIMQELMLKTIGNLHRYRGDAALRTWLLRLLHNIAYDYKAKKKSQQATSIDDMELERLLGHDPMRGLTLRLVVDNALVLLPEDQRAAIVLMDYHGFGLQSAAQILGVRPGTVKSRRARARRTLRGILKQEQIVAF